MMRASIVLLSGGVRELLSSRVVTGIVVAVIVSAVLIALVVISYRKMKLSALGMLE